MAILAATVSSRAGKGGLSRRPIRRARLLAVAAGFWLSLQLVLVIWWATVIERQARQLAELEALRGGSPDQAIEQWSRTRLMLMGESATSLTLLLAVSLLLAWLYFREHRRARAMQAFFASVTHELRTPLTSIRLQAEAIADGEQSVEFALRLLEDSHRLESQIDKTLELARIEGGGPLREQSIPLASWLPRTLAEISQAHGASLELQSSFAAELPPVLRCRCAHDGAAEPD
jgi:signal transduction histidine kinase